MPVPVMVRNTMDGPTVLSSDPKGSEFVEWQGAGDPQGGDVQICPASITDTVAFHKCVQRGILVLENPEDNPEIAQAIERQTQAWHDRQRLQTQRAQESISRDRNLDSIVLPCVGPGARGARCGVEVPVKEQTKNDKPPLCSQHAHLAHEYVPQQGEIVDGKATVGWLRMTVGRRETGD